MVTEKDVYFRLLTPELGAVVENLSWTAASKFQNLETIKSAFDQYLVLIFEPHAGSAEQLRDFVRLFGPLFEHHKDDGVLPVEDGDDLEVF